VSAFDVRPDEAVVVSQTRRLFAHDSFPERGAYMGVPCAGLPAGVPIILPRAAAVAAAAECADVEIVDADRAELPEWVSTADKFNTLAWIHAGPATAPAPRAPRSRRSK